MTRYIRLLNNIKANIRTLALTPSQEACRRRIEEHLVYPGVVNLYGASGTGKTVLGWAIASDERGSFVQRHLQQSPQATTPDGIVVVDNAAAERGRFRRVLAELESAGIVRMVIVTRLPADDYVFRAELNLTDEDIAVARRNLTKFGYQTSETRFATMWHLVLQAAMEG
jgi:hypothetical protein